MVTKTIAATVGAEPVPRADWKHKVLTTEPPGTLLSAGPVAEKIEIERGEVTLTSLESCSSILSRVMLSCHTRKI